jgi:uncharacterized protein (DUF2342 family)
MNTLPRFRMPDESSSQQTSAVTAARALAEEALDFDDLDNMKTRVLDRDAHARPPIKAANVDDVVEELRAAAAGRSSKVRELTSNDLLEDVPDADAFQEVDVSELVFDRVVARREVWNVRQAAHAPPSSIAGPQPVKARFLVTAFAAMSLGALLAVVIALLIWHFSGVSL